MGRDDKPATIDRQGHRFPSAPNTPGDPVVVLVDIADIHTAEGRSPASRPGGTRSCDTSEVSLSRL